MYIGPFKHPGPLDQTDLKEQRRCNPRGGGELTYQGEADRWDPQAGRPIGGAGQPHMEVTRALLWW